MTMVEVKQSRTRDSKTFQLHGGRYRTIVANYSLHVENCGKWEDIGLDNYTDVRGAVHYTNLPFHLTVQGNHLQVRGRSAGYSLDVTTRPEEATYKVSEYGFKSYLPFSSRERVPKFVEIQVLLSGLTYDQDPAGGLIRIYRNKKLIWRMKRPVLIDAKGDTIGLDMNTISGEKELLLHIALPGEWLDAPDRAWPVIFDPTYNSDELEIESSDTTTHTVAANKAYTAGTAKCRWKGVSVEGDETLTETHSTNQQTLNWHGSIYAAFPSVPSGGVFAKLKSYHRVYTGGSQLIGRGSNPWWEGPYWSYSGGGLDYSATSSESTNSGYIGQNAQTYQGIDYGSVTCIVTAYTYYYYTPEVKTTDPAVTISGNQSKVTGTVDDGVNTDWITLSGFSGSAENSMSHSIAGSTVAKFEFKYDYTWKRPTAVGYCRVKDGNGDVIDLPLAELDDPALEYSYVRIALGEDILAADLVDTDNVEAGPVRVQTPDGVKSWRTY